MAISVGLGVTGTLEVDLVRTIVLEMVLDILDPTLLRAPTAATVTVAGGWPSDDIAFSVDGGAAFFNTTLDSEGGLAPTSLNIMSGNAGTHTLTVTSLTLQPGWSSSVTFTLEEDAATTPASVAPDTDPVSIPAADTGTGVRRWVLQDLMPGGLGSYVMPTNPSRMTAPEFQRVIAQQHTTAVDSGRFHLFEGGTTAIDWQFEGYIADQDQYLVMEAYAGLKRRFYIIDHRNRAWQCTITSFDAKPRKRQRLDGGEWNDWAADYTITALVYDQQWVTP